MSNRRVINIKLCGISTIEHTKLLKKFNIRMLVSYLRKLTKCKSKVGTVKFENKVYGRFQRCFNVNDNFLPTVPNDNIHYSPCGYNEGYS